MQTMDGYLDRQIVGLTYLDIEETINSFENMFPSYPKHSMYGLFAYIWLV